MQGVDQGGWGRREFLTAAGLGAIELAAGSGLAVAQSAGERGAVSGGGGGGGAPPKVTFPPIFKATERAEGPPPNPDAPAARVGYALVGLGRLSLGEIVPALAGECKHSKLTALVTGDRAKGLAVAQQYGIDARHVYTYQEYDRLRDDRDVQAVYIALPNSMHAEYTARAAGAGKHVLCEKPMANTVAECQQMIDACKQANRLLMIAYRIQYEPHNRQAQKLLRENAFGRVRLLEMVNAQAQGTPDQWRHVKKLAGGGSLPDIGLYCLNTARFLTGEEPVEIRAMEYSPPNDPRFREVEDTVLWQMRFPSGVLANCTTSYSSHTSKRYRANCDDGWVGLDPAFTYRGLRMETMRAEGPATLREQRQLPEKSQFALEIDHFSECVRANRRPYTPGEEGLQDQRLMDAIYRAAREGKPVTLEAVAGKDAFRGAPPAATP